MRVLIDYRPALRERTGAGEYIHNLVRAYTRHTAANGADVAVFTSAWQTLGRGPHLPRDGYMLFVGTLEPRKNVGALLDAYERLLERRADAPPLVLAGTSTPARPVAHAAAPAAAGRPGPAHRLCRPIAKRCMLACACSCCRRATKSSAFRCSRRRSRS